MTTKRLNNELTIRVKIATRDVYANEMLIKSARMDGQFGRALPISTLTSAGHCPVTDTCVH